MSCSSCCLMRKSHKTGKTECKHAINFHTIPAPASLPTASPGLTEVASVVVPAAAQQGGRFPPTFSQIELSLPSSAHRALPLAAAGCATDVPPHSGSLPEWGRGICRFVYAVHVCYSALLPVQHYYSTSSFTIAGSYTTLYTFAIAASVLYCSNAAH